MGGAPRLMLQRAPCFPYGLASVHLPSAASQRDSDHLLEMQPPDLSRTHQHLPCSEMQPGKRVGGSGAPVKASDGKPVWGWRKQRSGTLTHHKGAQEEEGSQQAHGSSKINGSAGALRGSLLAGVSEPILLSSASPAPYFSLLEGRLRLPIGWKTH